MTDQTPERKAEDYVKLGRTMAENHLETEKKKIPRAGAGHRITEFITRRVWTWLYYYLDSRFGANHPYPDYSGSEDKGIYPLHGHAAGEGEEVTLALCADWATYTRQSIAVAERMADHHPDYTLHLGDTYFVGEPKEVKANFIAPGSPWVRGSRGSFAVLGNHEMYARGIAFFEDLLPTLGLCVNGVYQGQGAGFVCLENEHWRVLALDTGYHSIGKIPLLEMLPWLGPNCRLDDKLMHWLVRDVKLDDPADRRGLVILTHHQYITAFNEGEFPRPARQLAALIGQDRPVLWIWGHEHKFAMYEKARIGRGITAYGRCIGHGGMPVELKTFKRKKSRTGADKLVVVDERVHRSQLSRKNPLGYNGYALMNFRGAELSITYSDFFQPLVTEQWTVHPDGSLSGQIIPAPDCPLQPVPGKRWPDAVA